MFFAFTSMSTASKFYADIHGHRWEGDTMREVIDQIDEYEEMNNLRPASYIINDYYEQQMPLINQGEAA